MADPVIYLYQDALLHLADFVGGGAADAEQSKLRKAIQLAYARLNSERSWQHLYGHTRINLNASYNTGTIDYDHTGGSSERLVTLTGGTWPTWAKQGRLLFNDVVYEVEQRLGGTTLTLTEALNPGADVAAGTTYTIYQNIYQLPGDFKRLCEPIGETFWASSYIRPNDWMWFERNLNETGEPYRWTIAEDRDRSGQMALYVSPYPSTAATFDAIYQRYARTLKLTGYESKARTGTVTISAAGTAVTGTGTSFSSDMVGSYIRFSGDANVPDGLGGLNPYAEQVKIRSFTSTTSITLDAAMVSAYSGAGFVVSDPVDIPLGMLDAFLRCCEWQYCLLAPRRDAGDYYNWYREARLRAMENDSVYEGERAVGGKGLWSDRGFTSPIGANVE